MPPAEQWADALHRWLGVTEDHVHVVHSSKDAQRVPQKGLQFLIVSYNFVPKMVQCQWGLGNEAVVKGPVMHRGWLPSCLS